MCIRDRRKHEAAVIDGEGTVIIKPFSFTNNCSGYNRLLAMLTKAKLPLDCLLYTSSCV